MDDLIRGKGALATARAISFALLWCVGVGLSTFLEWKFGNDIRAAWMLHHHVIHFPTVLFAYVVLDLVFVARASFQGHEWVIVPVGLVVLFCLQLFPASLILK